MAKVKCEICNRNFKNEEALELHNQAKHEAKLSNSDSAKKPKNKFIVFGIILVVILAGIIYFSMSKNSAGNYDSFAQCITDSGAKMYGAYWCPHCQDQEELFGNSWKYINYVECSLPNRGGQNQVCNDAGIESYPTWEFSDGSRSTGVFTLEQLGQLTGCEFTQNTS